MTVWDPQVNNVFIFPGMSFGAVCCQASSIPESFFLAAAEAVANSLGHWLAIRARGLGNLQIIKEFERQSPFQSGHLRCRSPRRGGAVAGHGGAQTGPNPGGGEVVGNG